MEEEIEREISIWKELKKRYEEEIEMGNDVDINTFLKNNAEREIEDLIKLKIQ